MSLQSTVGAVSAWPVMVQADGPIAAGALASRTAGRIVLTAVVKATYAFVADGPMTGVLADDLIFSDAHLAGDVRRSLVAASDLAPYRPRADVTLTGHAMLRAAITQLRLAVVGRQAALDKTLHLVSKGPFAGSVTVPLVYEEAFGGPGREDNPAGSAVPRLVDPLALTRPGCFAPIPRAWPMRNRLAGGVDPRTLEGVLLQVPGSFDWDHYQAAPVDQRVPFLAGDEWILLAGLHPTLPTLTTQLPSVRAAVEIKGLGSGSASIEMHLDTLHLDIDRGRCNVVFRGSVAVPSGVPLSSLGIRARVDDSQRQERKSSRPAAKREAIPIPGAPWGSVPAARPPAVRGALDGTMALRVVGDDRFEESSTAIICDGSAASLRALGAPFAVSEPSGSRPPAADIPGAPWAMAKVEAAPAPAPFENTTDVPKSISAALRAAYDAKASDSGLGAAVPSVASNEDTCAKSEAPKPIPRDVVWSPSPSPEVKPQPAPVPARPAPPAAAVAVRKDVYGGFGPRKRQ